MSDSTFELSSGTSNSAFAAGGLVGSSHVCQVGETQVQDSFTPSYAHTLPSPAQLRALRSEVGGSANCEPGAPVSTVRFHPSIWDALGVKSSAPVVEPPQARTTTEPPAASGADALPPPVQFSAELWYAQAASQELHLKREQLSFRPLRSAPPEDLDVAGALTAGIQN